MSGVFGKKELEKTQIQHKSIFKNIKEVILRPEWAMSDISIDQPILSGVFLALFPFLFLGVTLGFAGNGVLGGGILSAVISSIIIGFGGLFFLVCLSLSLLVFGRIYDGSGTFKEIFTPILFTSIPFYAALFICFEHLLRGSISMGVAVLILLLSTVWTLRLMYFAVKTSHRFTGFQSVLTLFSPVLFIALGTMVVFFASIMVSLALL
jgi:hypothetical protein